MYNKTRSLTRWLKVPLTDKELIEKAKELSEKQETLQQTEAEKAEKMREFGETIKTLKGTVNNLTKIILSGSENRTVQCIEEVNLIEKKARIVRLDTFEVIQSRNLEEFELQTDLFSGDAVIEPEAKESEAAEKHEQIGEDIL